MASRGSVLTARIALPLLGAGALGLLVAVSHAFACTSLATLALTPNAAVAGTAVQASAAQFSPSGSQIVFRWNSRGGPVLGSSSPDAKGSTTISFVVPAAAPGNYVVIAQQTVTNIPQGGSAIATVQFTIPGASANGAISGGGGTTQNAGSAAAQSVAAQNAGSAPVQSVAAQNAGPAPAQNIAAQPAPRDGRTLGVPAASGVGAPALDPGVAGPLAPAVDAQGDTTTPRLGNGFRDEFGLRDAAPSRQDPAPMGSTMSAGALTLLVTAGVFGMGATASGAALAVRSRSVPLRRTARGRGKRST